MRPGEKKGRRGWRRDEQAWAKSERVVSACVEREVKLVGGPVDMIASVGSFRGLSSSRLKRRV